MKQTPLYTKHIEAGGKIIDFGGWALPVQYRGIIEEHEAVRRRAGLFDVSHMGELWVEGPDALAFLQQLVTNDLSRAKDGQAVYSPMCQDDGGVVDDLLLYRISEDRWILVVNAANTAKDETWIRTRLSGRVSLTNRSEETAQLAIQGPLAEAILQRLTPVNLSDIRFYRFMTDVPVTDIPVLVSRTGYTGEDGFELYFQAEDAPVLWDRLLDA
ncbi:MAG: glycine cleavage system aminomethyltransferase GcvT, partial [Bacillota bacterium]|nr:glycine cleavage system aminomethyltransferase GcvT [Bacillota bacterium]